MQLQRDARAERNGQRDPESVRARTAAPPAKANGNGRKPAARRACDSDTASENGVNRTANRRIASRLTEPPRTYADHRRRDAKAASGSTSNATIATAPARPSISGASRNRVGENTSIWPT